MAERKNEVGNRYGKLLVLEYAGTNGHNALWKCRCDCGKECVKLGVSLRCGHTRSCGCYHVVGAGDKVAQLVLMPYIVPELELVDKLSETERGNNGFGSSGK